MAEPTTTGQRIWGVLNSSFVIFLFSVVAVGLISQFYAEKVEREKAEVVNGELIQRLNAEIEHRLRYVFYLGIGRELTPAERVVVWYAIAGSDQNVRSVSLYGESFAPLFPQFDERSLYSLVWELNALEDDPELASIVEAVSQITIIFSLLQRVDSDGSEAWVLSADSLERYRSTVWMVISDAKSDSWELLVYGTPDQPTALADVTATADSVLPSEATATLETGATEEPAATTVSESTAVAGETAVAPTIAAELTATLDPSPTPTMGGTPPSTPPPVILIPLFPQQEVPTAELEQSP